MNNRTLFELIGTVDDQMLEHSEWTAPKRMHNFSMKKAFILAAAVISVLAITLTAAAVTEGTNILNLILGAFSQSDADYVPDQNVIQAQLDQGQWIFLNGENVAVIVPDSPAKIMLSNDGGATWKESVVQDSDKMEIYGDMRDDTQYLGGYIGFFGESNGYLVLTAGVAMNDQPMRIYLTSDGGETWSEIGNPYSAHASVLTGAGFSTPDIGFISYRYYEDAGPDIWWTSDGGDTWQKLLVTLPKKYTAEEYRFTPQTPTFEGKDGIYPIAVLNPETETEDVIYMYSHDYGLTWAFE